MATNVTSPPTFSHLTLTEEGAWARIRIESGKANQIGSALMDEIHLALDYVEQTPSVSVLSFAGRAGVFCAGADLSEIQAIFAHEDPSLAMGHFAQRIQRTMDRIAALPHVTIAEIDGPAMGGGLELALACDFRLASDRARLGLPETSVGLIPAAGGTFRLRELVGLSAARRMILTGMIVKPGDALALGLVDRVVEGDQANAHMTSFIEGLTARPQSALRAAKRCLGADDRSAAQAEIDGISQLAGEGETQRLVEGFLSGAR